MGGRDDKHALHSELTTVTRFKRQLLQAFSTLFSRFVVRIGLFLMIMMSGCASGAVASGQVTALPALPSRLVTATQAVSATPRPTLIVSINAQSVTATPLSVALAPGSARQIALSTDMPLQPTPRARIDFKQEPVLLKFDEFYDGYSIRNGLILSDKLVSLDGKKVQIEGYMAPPLKAQLDFFVLTRVRLAFCPFCSTAADWPDDIALIYLPENNRTQAVTEPVRLTGRLDVGVNVDPETGLVSLVRVYADSVEILK